MENHRFYQHIWDVGFSLRTGSRNQDSNTTEPPRDPKAYHSGRISGAKM